MDVIDSRGKADNDAVCQSDANVVARIAKKCAGKIGADFVVEDAVRDLIEVRFVALLENDKSSLQSLLPFAWKSTLA